MGNLSSGKDFTLSGEVLYMPQNIKNNDLWNHLIIFSKFLLILEVKFFWTLYLFHIHNK